MKPKEKAQELVSKFKDHVNPYIGSGMLSNTHDDNAILFQSKQCALILVDEILNLIETLHKPEYCSFYSSEEDVKDGYEVIAYWQEVRTEIENL